MADDETLIKDKSGHKAINVLGLPSPKKRLSKDNIHKKYSVELEKPIVFPSFQSKLASIMKSKIVDLAVLSLITAYTILVLISLVADDGCNNTKRMDDGLLVMEYIELGIFSSFMVETCLRVLAFGFNVTAPLFSIPCLLSPRVILRTFHTLLILSLSSSHLFWLLSTSLSPETNLEAFEDFVECSDYSESSSLSERYRLNSLISNIKTPSLRPVNSSTFQRRKIELPE